MYSFPNWTSPLGFPDSSDGKASAYNAGDLDSIPGSGRSPGERNGNPLQYSCLENPMGRGAWGATVRGVTKSRTWLSDFTFHFHIVPCLVLTVASWPANRFLRRQVRWSGIPISLRVFQFVVIHTVKGFSIVNEAKVDFLEFPCFFYDRMDVCNLISGSSTFSESSLYNWKISDHILLKTSLKDFEHYLDSMWNECNCTVVWTFFGTTFLWDWNENPSAPQEKPTQEASVLQWRVAPTCCN